MSDEIIRSRAGVRVRIGNTDAEGRLVLADLLARAQGDRRGAPTPRAPLARDADRPRLPRVRAVHRRDRQRARRAPAAYVDALDALGEPWGEPIEMDAPAPRGLHVRRGPRSRAEDVVSVQPPRLGQHAARPPGPLRVPRRRLRACAAARCRSCTSTSRGAAVNPPTGSSDGRPARPSRRSPRPSRSEALSDGIRARARHARHAARRGGAPAPSSRGRAGESCRSSTTRPTRSRCSRRSRASVGRAAAGELARVLPPRRAAHARRRAVPGRHGLPSHRLRARRLRRVRALGRGAAVPDVQAVADHIACDSTTRSELVLPVLDHGASFARCSTSTRRTRTASPAQRRRSYRRSCARRSAARSTVWSRSSAAAPAGREPRFRQGARLFISSSRARSRSRMTGAAAPSPQHRSRQ